MSFFERLKTKASAEWRAYTEHPFTNGLADGSLAEAAFCHYLVQDYLFLTEFLAPTRSPSTSRPSSLTCAKRRPASRPSSTSR
jgi:thiaminase